MWFTVYHMIGPNMSDQKGNPNTSYLLGYQNVPKHHNDIQENFHPSTIGRGSFLFNFSEYAVFKRLHTTLFVIQYNSELFMSHLY